MNTLSDSLSPQKVSCWDVPTSQEGQHIWMEGVGEGVRGVRERGREGVRG